jgi:hypothetical protein
MSASRLVTLVVAAASAYSTFVAAQTVNCGSAGRNTIISDEIFQSKKIGNTVLPKLRDTICNFTPDGYCLPFGRCVLQTIIQDGVNEIALNLNKTLIIPPGGGTAQLGPCSVIMVRQFTFAFIDLLIYFHLLVLHSGKTNNSNSLGSNHRSVHRWLQQGHRRNGHAREC